MEKEAVFIIVAFVLLLFFFAYLPYKNDKHKQKFHDAMIENNNKEENEKDGLQ